jgi:hypothetical protein
MKLLLTLSVIIALTACGGGAPIVAVTNQADPFGAFIADGRPTVPATIVSNPTDPFKPLATGGKP